MIESRTTYSHLVEKVAALLLLVYPTAMLTVRGGMNAVMLLMLILALLVWLKPPAGLHRVAWQPVWSGYFISMFGLSVAVLISQLANNDLAGHPHDAASRLWLALCVFWFLLKLRASVFRVLQFAFPVAAIAGWLLAEDVGYGFTLRTLDKIHFGNYLLLLGALSLFSIDWFGKDDWPLRLLKLAGFTFGLLASLESGTRGGWLAIPVFIGIYFFFRASRLSLRAIGVSIFLGGLIIVVAYFASAIVQERIEQLAGDVSSYEQGDRDTSTGIRWQLYKAALDIFVHHPLTGVGPEGFAREMQPMMLAGKLTPDAAELGRGEVHNDILAKMAGMGVFGLAAIIALYLLPLHLFFLAIKATQSQVRRAGILGVTFVTGHVVFGLSQEFLSLTMATAFYGFTVAVLLAACQNLHYDA